MIPNIYPNIDLHYYNNQTGIKYYFVIKPGGNPNSISHLFQGAISETIINNNLEVNTSLGSFTFRQPEAYQVNLNLNIIPAGVVTWSNISANQYKFNLSNYNSNLPLIIMVDQGHAMAAGGGPPIDNLLWSTYYGGSGVSTFRDVTNDNFFGNAYVTGNITSADFPLAQGQSFTPIFSDGADAVVIKINNLMEPQWVTFFGGATAIDSNDPSADDIPFSIAVTGGGDRIMIGGKTVSTDLPIEDNNGNYWSDDILTSYSGFNIDDAFIAEFNSIGTLVWSTYFGDDGYEIINDIDFDNAGNLYCVGMRAANTPVFPLSGADNYPAISTTSGNPLLGSILRFSPARQLDWANPYEVDEITSVSVDASNNVHFVGITSQLNTPVLNSSTDPQFSFTSSLYGFSLDGFVAKFNPNGVLNYSFYYGGPCNDYISSVSADVLGNVYFLGGSGDPGCNVSQTFPVVGGFSLSSNTPELFMGKILPQSSGNPVNIDRTSYFGGGGSESDGVWQNSEIVAHKDHIFITARTNSALNNFLTPTIEMPAQQPSGFYVQNDLAGQTVLDPDAFIAGFDRDFNLLWSTYFGGQNIDVGTALSYSISDDRLYFVGGTFTNNAILNPTLDDLLPLQEFDPTPGSNDYYQDEPMPINSYPAWIACFYVKDIDSPSPVSINEVSMGNQVSIYPNPFIDCLNIESADEIFSVKVFDITGKLILVTNPNSNRTIIELNVERGAYFLEIKTENDFFQHKITKM